MHLLLGPQFFTSLFCPHFSDACEILELVEDDAPGLEAIKDRVKNICSAIVT